MRMRSGHFHIADLILAHMQLGEMTDAEVRAFYAEIGVRPTITRPAAVAASPPEVQRGRSKRSKAALALLS